MGKIVISSNSTLDGVVQDPDGEEGFARGGWFHRFVGADDLQAWVARETEELRGVEALLFGRRSSGWFETRMLSRDDAETRVSPEWATGVKSLPKYIVSSTLDRSRWSNATILNGDAAKEISELKRTMDGEILVYGSYQLVCTLIDHGLADELRLVVFPVVLGTGLRLFDETSQRPLRLVDIRKIGRSLAFHTYEFQRS
ncbi:deaminase [Nocardia yunnanensis]|uniref:Deaminase n=1 Tax=Nocardia yunnanensis TaxID=2382165 RepID=A0A386ZNZ8_9NOCA|nr:dihydrofolate reductase family protein [Nocardia yunnanensis]AYF79317.1 deaminase [Nocardia yunnanensis]